MIGRLAHQRWALPPLRIEQLWVVTVLMGIVVFLDTHPIRPHDFWWHLRVGQQIVTARQIPTVDVFSFTMPGASYANYAPYWLADAALYVIYALGGAALIVAANTALIAAAYAIVLLLSRRAGRSLRVGALCTLFAAALGFGNWNVRPQSISYLLGALVLWAIAEYHDRPRRWLLLAIPATLLVWVNCHGSFVIGLVLIGFWLVDEVWNLLRARLWGATVVAPARLWPPLAVLGLSFLACLANPRGAGAFGYLAGMMADPVVRAVVSEWQPASIASLDGTLFLAGIILCTLIFAESPRRPSLTQMLRFVAFAAFGLSSERGIVWFGLIMAPVLAEHAAAFTERIRAEWPQAAGMQAVNASEHRGVNYAIAGMLVLGAVVTVPWFKESLPFPRVKAGLLSYETPVAATRFLLENRLPGNLFHSASAGSYLIWAAWPEYQVFTDTRFELYPAALWMDYLQISRAQGDWDSKLQGYGVNTLLLSREEQPALVQAAMQSTEWRAIHGDTTAVILVRTSSP